MSNLAAKFAFFPPSPPTYEVKKRDSDGKVVAVSTAAAVPIPQGDDPLLNVHVIETKRGNKIVAFYLQTLMPGLLCFTHMEMLLTLVNFMISLFSLKSILGST